MGKRENFYENSKLFHDYIKHVNTLSTGSILLFVTFMEKLSYIENTKWIMGVSIICFLVSIIRGVMTKSNWLQLHPDDSEKSSSLVIITLNISYNVMRIFFLLGITGLTVFGIINFLS